MTLSLQLLFEGEGEPSKRAMIKDALESCSNAAQVQLLPDNRQQAAVAVSHSE